MTLSFHKTLPLDDRDNIIGIHPRYQKEALNCLADMSSMPSVKCAHKAYIIRLEGLDRLRRLFSNYRSS